MEFGLKFGLFGLGSGSIQDNACMLPKKEATWNGHIDGSGSTITPSSTVSGLPVFDCKWDATDLTGEVEFALGALGNTQEPNANSAIISKDGYSAIVVWDVSAERYLGVNLDFTTYMNTLVVEDEELCMVIAYLPVLLAHYDFSKLEIGVVT